MEPQIAVDQPIAPVTPPAPAAEPAARVRLLDDDGKLLPGMTPEWRQPAAKAPEPKPEPTGDDAPALDATGQPVNDAKGQPLTRKQQREQDAERRTREAVDRAVAGVREQYEARLAALEGRAPQPTQEPRQAPAAPAEDKEPTIEDFPIDQFLDKADPYGAQVAAYARALNKYDRQQEVKAERAANETRTAQDRAVQTLTETVKGYQTREDAYKTTRPDFDAKTADIRSSLNPTSPLALALLQSDVAPQLIEHFADHRDEFNRIGQLGSSNLAAALVQLGTLAAKFTPAAGAASAQPAAAPPKTVTDAPPIGTVLGSQPAAAADEAKAAIARKDFRSFDEIETAKDLARLRSRGR